LRNASNDLTFDLVEPPVDISTPRILSVQVRLENKNTSTVSIKIHKDAIFDRLKIITLFGKEILDRFENIDLL
jgi:hypothetical protein